MKIEIQPGTGFCFGVALAVETIEKNLQTYNKLKCLGSIVHNPAEIQRLQDLGLELVSHPELEATQGEKILVRSHGEPPETFEKAAKRGNEIIDATCPVVKKLQSRIKQVHENHPEKQILVYGNPGHPELVGLVGQTNNSAFIIDDNYNGLEKIDFSKPMVLFSQTTQGIEGFKKLGSIIRSRVSAGGNDPSVLFVQHHTICGQVSQRGPKIKEFARKHDVMIFVGGKNSSNGKYLFGICVTQNPKSYFIENPRELQKSWFENADSIGVSGATSTPMWQLEGVAEAIRNLKLNR